MIQRHKLKLSIAVPLLLSLLLFVLSSRLNADKNGLNAVLEKLSGPYATDCGAWDKGQNKCIFDAASTGEPFRALVGISFDKKYLVGTVRTPDLQLLDIDWKRGSWFSNGGVSKMERFGEIKINLNDNSIYHYQGTYLTRTDMDFLLENRAEAKSVSEK